MQIQGFSFPNQFAGRVGWKIDLCRDAVSTRPVLRLNGSAGTRNRRGNTFQSSQMRLQPDTCEARGLRSNSGNYVQKVVIRMRAQACESDLVGSGCSAQVV